MELFQLMKKHVCDGRWEVRDSTLEFITQLTANLKGNSKYTETLHSSGMISVLFTSLSDLEGYVQASAVAALGEAVTTSDVCSNVQEKAVTHLLSILSQDTQSFPHRAAVKVFTAWLKSPHCCTALEQSLSSVLLLGGEDFDWEFIPKVFDEVEVRALCGPVKFFHTKLIQPCLYGPCFVHWGTVMLE
ncbi:hypothetical protein PGIGA_G00158990 [Pangasianodon gigas]|uniref:Uncharacterized protein n=1 Tax=Pangasianodon gigas TaxID=30993 RepID=A0ACC5XR35_PANGG|nr:hypothetical protein [Pangasianodon gigas]